MLWLWRGFAVSELREDRDIFNGVPLLAPSGQLPSGTASGVYDLP